MSTQTKPRSEASEPRRANVAYPYLTWKQLKKQYPDQWVLLLNPVSATSGYRVSGGQFVAASTNQMGMLTDARKLPKGSRISVIYTGSVALPPQRRYACNQFQPCGVGAIGLKMTDNQCNVVQRLDAL